MPIFGGFWFTSPRGSGTDREARGVRVVRSSGDPFGQVVAEEVEVALAGRRARRAVDEPAPAAEQSAGSIRRAPRYLYESRRRYFVAHHGRAYAIAADLA